MGQYTTLPINNLTMPQLPAATTVGSSDTAWIVQGGTDKYAPIGHFSESMGIYNVKAFGATGDGVTDDTVAIQAAVTAALSGLFGTNVFYGKIFFPPGDYLVTASINVPPASSGSRSIIFEGVGSASNVSGDFADFIFTSTFGQPNPGIVGFRNMAIFNSSTDVESGAIRFVNVLQGAFYENLSIGGMTGIHTAENFAPRITNCHISGTDVSHLANSVGIRFNSGGGGSIQDCIIRGYNNGIRINGGVISNCDIESNMIGIAAGANPALTNIGTADGYSTDFLGGAVTILGCAFEANAVALWVAAGKVCTINSGIIADAFCSPETARLGGVIVTGDVTNASPTVLNIAPNTTGLFPGQFLKKNDQNGDTYIISTVDSAVQVTLTGNWNSGTQLGQTLFGERLSRDGLRVRFGNHSTFVNTTVSGPYTDVAWKMDNPGGECFINCSAINDGGSETTWSIPGSGWNFIGNFTSFGENPPDSATSRAFSTLPSTPREGDSYSIIDSSTAVFRAAVTVGGSSNHVEVRWDGSSSSWRVSG